MESSVFNPPYTPFISVLFITVLVALLNLPIMTTLWHYSFDDGTYSHAFLVPFIVLYLYYTLHESNELQFRSKISWPALILLILSAYSLFVASTAQITLAYWLATLMLLCASINFIFIPSIKLFFPALYFIFLIPLWGILTIPLQDLSVIAVNTLMGFTSIPVFVENQFVHIPSGVFEIAGGCSGLRYLLTSLAISSLFIFLHLRNIKNIVAFAALAILGALITNWLRIAILIIIGHQTEMTSDLMTDHNMFGWYLYAPFMLLLFKVGGTLADKENNVQSVATALAKMQSNKINWLLVTVLMLSILLTATTYRNQAKTPYKTNFVDVLVQPKIYNTSTVDIIKNDTTTTHLIYHFNHANLESKPTFFENSFIPENWHIVSHTINTDDQVFIVSKGVEFAKIIVSYDVSGIKVGSSTLFKLERLKQAMVGNNLTKLHWRFESQ